jgi:hypothetical protein
VTAIWLPSDPMLDARAEVDAERQAYAEERVAQMRHLIAELRRIDPYLDLVKVREDSPGDATVIPGYWHVVRHNPDAPDTWMPITGEDGEFAEPTSRIFDKLAEGDMWRDEHKVRARKRQAKDAADREREKERRRERLSSEMNERVLAATRTQISMNPDTPWTQNVDGRRGRKAA